MRASGSVSAHAQIQGSGSLSQSMSGRGKDGASESESGSGRWRRLRHGKRTRHGWQARWEVTKEAGRGGGIRWRGSIAEEEKGTK
eukprot:1059445-Pleurochrysis_carterae.AAC.1